MIRAGELTRLRARVNGTFTAEATVLRKVQVADTTGGFTDTYTTVGTYDCSFSPHQVTPTERETTIGVQTIALWTFLFPVGTDIRTTDRLVASGRTFEVVSSGDRSVMISKRVICLELT